MLPRRKPWSDGGSSTTFKTRPLIKVYPRLSAIFLKKSTNKRNISGAGFDVLAELEDEPTGGTIGDDGAVGDAVLAGVVGALPKGVLVGIGLVRLLETVGIGFDPADGIGMAEPGCFSLHLGQISKPAGIFCLQRTQLAINLYPLVLLH